VNIVSTALEGVYVVEPAVYGDHRGYFMEIHQLERYRQTPVNRIFVQDNLSFSGKGTLRGLHYQLTHPQAKLIQVVTGEIYDVAVDIRQGSPTFGKWIGVHLSDRNHRQIFIPEGFAHGFCVLSEAAHVLYKCTEFYYPEDEQGILWSDPGIGIDWPVENPNLSEKDRRFARLRDTPPHRLYRTGGRP
jgi:dTDP-4-dehydrorhamnose 3,5-epimerase